MSLEEFNLITDKIQGKVVFLYFHLMGEPLLHPDLSRLITIARDKGFKTILTSNGTLLNKAMDLLDALPHKIQLSLHSHESNGRGVIEEYVDKVMQFSIKAASKGTCVVLRLWNQGGKESENEKVIKTLEEFIPQPWIERPDGYRLCDNLYLEYDRKFQWPEIKSVGPESLINQNNNGDDQVYCKALIKQIGVLADGSLVPCCLDHNGDVILGNLFTQSLDEILNSPRAIAMIEGFKHHKASESLCRNCESALINNSFRGKARK